MYHQGRGSHQFCLSLKPKLRFLLCQSFSVIAGGRTQTLRGPYLARHRLKTKSLDLVPGTPGFLTSFNSMIAGSDDFISFFSLTLTQLQYNSCILGLAPKIICLDKLMFSCAWSVLRCFTVILICSLILVLRSHFSHLPY